jgi:hypothetical protein
MITRHQSCRFCHRLSFEPSTEMVRFAKRHWAHKTCWLERRGIAGLSPPQIASMPYMTLKRLDLLDQVEEALRPYPALSGRAQPGVSDG